MNRRRADHGTVYALRDPRTGAIRYVGKTVVIPRDRFLRHVRDALSYGVDTHVARWIRTLDTEPVFSILEQCSIEDVAEAECRWIAKAREEGCRLTNLTDGGDGVPGYRASPETCAKIGAVHRGKIMSAETKAKIAATKLARYGPPRVRKTPEEVSAITSARMKKRWAERREEMLVVAAKARASRKPDTAETREKRAAWLRQIWADPIVREQRSRAISAGKRRANA